MRIRRRNTAWLTVMGLLIGLALLSGSVTAPVTVALLAIFAIATIASLVDFGGGASPLVENIRRAPLRGKMTPEAKEAETRAKSRGVYYGGGVNMLDVGLIAVQTSQEGMAMRRTLSASKDDDGIRPYITLYVAQRDAERHANVRFEILDQYGEPRFMYETKKYLREGEVTVMSDNYLRLYGNDKIKGAGDWEARVYVDGNLMSIQNFTLTPSINDRTNRLSRASADIEDEDDPLVVFDIMDEVKENKTPSLQELLEKKESTSMDNSEENITRRRNSTARRRR
jgi:hypothetical protein